MKLTDFTEDDIKYYLSEIKELIKNDNFNIELNKNREENIDFIEDYNINSKKRKEILLSLEHTDFCYAANNNNPKFSHEILYIFNKVYALYKNGEDCSETVDIYIKTNKIDTKNGKKVIVISFHKRNQDIEYLFK